MHILQFWTHGDSTHTWEIVLGMDENHNLSWNQYENRHSKLLTDIFFVELFSWKVQGKWLKLFNELYLVWAPKRASKNQRYFFTTFSVQLLKCLPSSGPPPSKKTIVTERSKCEAMAQTQRSVKYANLPLVCILFVVKTTLVKICTFFIEFKRATIKTMYIPFSYHFPYSYRICIAITLTLNCYC